MPDAVPSARELLDTVDSYVLDPNQPATAAGRPPKHAIVDLAYSGSGRPRVTFDGESVMGGRTYVSLVPVRAGDRVVMMASGSTYVILGVVDAAPGSTFIVGQSIAGYWATAPAGFLLEDGSVQLRASYPALFAVLGTLFNTGGETTLQFRLPDSRGRVLVNKGGTAFTTLGLKVGEEAHTLTNGELAQHTHPIYASSAGSAGVSISVTSNSNGDRVTYLPGGLAALGTKSGTEPGGLAHNNNQPSIVVTRCIKF